MRTQILRMLSVCCAFLCSIIMLQAQEKKTVAGTVLDSVGNPLAGVSVKTNGALSTTDEKGRFKVLASANDVVMFSMVGYETVQKKVGTNKEITVSLKPSYKMLDDVVVTALGIKKEQRKVGYATTVIKGDEITKAAPTNFASALYGKAAGVTITSNTGGATSAVGIQIRGINSIGFQRQPLLVVDGIIIRDGDANNEGYWNNQKINGNGLLDINPDNIETINILKGAAASALYGSDATFGVIVITTKSGKGIKKGLGIEVNLSAGFEKAATVPDMQTEYGPGYDWQTNQSLTGNDTGWVNATVNGQSVQYPRYRDYGQFGPKMDGRQIYYWDGTMRSYVGQNNWKSFYRTGHNTTENIALSNATDKMNYRFSYTRTDYEGIQIGGKQQKNSLNLNASYKITPKINFDVTASYINELVHNRPRQIYYLTNNYGGFFSPADFMDAFFNKYQTTKGYKWVAYNSNLDVTERLKYNIRSTDFLDYLWNQLANSYDETTNRFIASGTLSYNNIIKGLNFRGRIGTDYTGYRNEEKDRSTQPISFGATGYYGVNNNQYVFTSGDLLLSYNHAITKNLDLTVSAGYQGRKEKYNYVSANTNGGLTVENWFSLNASQSLINTGTASNKTLVKDGLFGIVNLSYNNYLFLEGTLRRERSSTLAPGNNIFNYPGISGAFELSNALKLPKFITYSKLRAAWGIVGNPPDIYYANVVYTAGNINGIPTFTPQTSLYGNNGLKNEEKHEIEFGWETKMLNNRLGFDVSYYNNTIYNQILNLTTPTTVGASGQIVNVGTMKNYGVEFSVFGTPVKSKNFSWDVRLNAGFNRNKVVSLMAGLSTLNHLSIDNSSMQVVSTPNRPSGDILGYVAQTDSKGNKIVGSDGYYAIDYSKMQVVGNIQPKTTGGIINSFTYKQVTLNTVIDYHWGGQVISLARLYGLGAGMYKTTLFGRDASHGGLPYYMNSSGSYVGVANNIVAGPNGETIHHDGVILKGVTSSGSANTTVIDAASYYENTFTWGAWPGSGSVGNYPEGAVYDNNFIKMREVSIAYTLPAAIRSKLNVQNLILSFYGRNLFYIYKSLPGLDPEEGVGTNYITNATSVGSGNAASRSYGVSLKVSF